jgi:hypothetical protein
MPNDSQSERLGLRGTIDLISKALRTAGTANATGAITAGASYRFFSDLPDLQWAVKQITIIFLFGVLSFTASYIALLIATLEIDNSLGRTSERQQWENILWAAPNKTAEEYAKLAKRDFIIAILSGLLSLVFFMVGLFVVMSVVLYL